MTVGPVLRVATLGKSFGGIAAVDGVGFEVEAGEIFALLGPSGCGKTTLLRLIAGLEVPDAGTIAIDGEDMTGVPAWRRPVNTVFQSYALFPHLDLVDNVAFSLKMKLLTIYAFRILLIQFTVFFQRSPVRSLVGITLN